MAVRMAQLKRTPSGLWTARKVIPQDVRESYGKREEKVTWPADLSQGQAKAEMGAWLAGLEERIAFLRAAGGGVSIDLTQRQSLALAGKWYGDMVAREGDNPGDPHGWEEALTQLYPEENDSSYEAYLRGDTVPYEGPWRPTPFLVAERDQLLAAESLHVTRAASGRLLDNMADLYVNFCHLMARRATGDYGVDPTASTLPAWEGVTPKEPKASGPTLMELFEGYVAEENPAPATVKAWKRIIEHLEGFLGHGDAERVSAEDLIRWKDHLLATPLKDGNVRSAKTVRDKYIASTKAVFNWAKRNRKVSENPAAGIAVGGRKRKRLRDPGLTNEEAEVILRATLEPQVQRLSTGHAAARRWVPWLCAYSGARVNEMSQLRKQDIFERDGVWAMNITPEAGSVKNDEARLVPLHSHLIEQGFLDFVAKAAAGPLFYEPKAHRGGTEGNPQYKKVGERLASWVRSLGVDDPNVQPNHGWRHRFKTVARGARMDPEAREVIPGHAPATEGQAYGTWTLKDLAEEIEKLPRFRVT